MMAKVLIVGYLDGVLQERTAAFSSAEFEVIPASDLQEAMRAIGTGSFDVVVLGHGVPESERNQIARSARDRNGRAKLLMLYLGSIHNAELADALLHGTVRPEEICSTVRYLLNPGSISQVG
ncbi:MAG TPA: hypothetical protein VFI72_11120 [Candidatus Angelobacter sp.]|nr:hypothetical protein [Candidatus Angelobacter sp.]